MSQLVLVKTNQPQRFLVISVVGINQAQRHIVQLNWRTISIERFPNTRLAHK